MGFFDPKAHNLHELYLNKELIPNSFGAYAWYFDDTFAGKFLVKNVPTVITVSFDTSHVQDWFLLYIGTAGRNRVRTLRDRIYDDHLNKNSNGSTLRQTLASLLWRDIGLNPRKRLCGEIEKKILNEWVFTHARVAWLESEDPGSIEDTMLGEFGSCLIFNIKDNKNNANAEELKRLRKTWREAGE